MADNDVLTQEEIDALLSGVDAGDVDTVTDAQGQQVATYDLANQDRVVRGRLPTLELVAERFARALGNTLPATFKFPIEIGPGGTQVLKYSEYLDTLYVPTCLRVLRIEPFAGSCLLTLDAKFIHRLVDLFFGGSGSAGSFESKEFSLTEQRVIKRLTDMVLSDFEYAWQDVMPIKATIIGEEINPNMLGILNPADPLMVCSFRLDLEDGGGELHIAFPYASLESFKSILHTTSKAQAEDTDDGWRVAMERSILDAEVPMDCTIGDAQLRLREVMRLQPGDVLDFNMQDVHPVRIANIPAFNASLGDSRGKFALEFESFQNN